MSEGARCRSRVLGGLEEFSRKPSQFEVIDPCRRRRSELLSTARGHEVDACSKSSIDFISLPVPDRGTPDDSVRFVRAAQGLADLLRKGSCVAIHCRQSVGRAGLLAVATALCLGIPLETAPDMVSTARGVRVPETREQETWLQHNAHLFVENASDG